MAEIKKKYFGEIKGKFGDAVFRQRGDKNFISQKAKYTKPDTEEFRNRTDTFKLSGKLASSINSNKYLKSIWQNKFGKNSAVYPNLISVNYSAFSGFEVIGNPALVPDNGIGVKVDTVAIDDDDLTMKLKPLTASSTIDTEIEKKIFSIVFLFVSDPINTASAPVQILSLNSAKQLFNLDDPITFVNPISTADNDIIKGYSNLSLYCTVITLDDRDNIVNYAKTFNPSLT